MIRAVLSIGSNMDDRYALLETVFEEFRDETIAQSPIYSTPPWGVPDQDEFLNAILIVNVAQTPRELLRRGQRLEAAAERRRTRKWGPRTLDVDIIQVIDANGVELVSEDPELILPHPWAPGVCIGALVGGRPGGPVTGGSGAGDRRKARYCGRRGGG